MLRPSKNSGPSPSEPIFDNLNRSNPVVTAISPNPECLNTEQAAAYLGISSASLRNMTSNGKVPFYKLGRRNRYRLPELRELLLSGTIIK